MIYENSNYAVLLFKFSSLLEEVTFLLLTLKSSCICNLQISNQPSSKMGIRHSDNIHYVKNIEEENNQ